MSPAAATRRPDNNATQDAGATQAAGSGSAPKAPMRRPVLAGVSSSLPRTLKARITSGRQLAQQKRKPAAPISPPSPNQESVVNPRTGKVALGPWLGPFGAVDGAMSPPLGLQSFGGLAVEPKLGADPSLRPAAAPSTASVQQQLLGLMSRQQLHKASAHASGPKYTLYTKPFESGRARKQARAINQPRADMH